MKVGSNFEPMNNNDYRFDLIIGIVIVALAHWPNNDGPCGSNQQRTQIQKNIYQARRNVLQTSSSSIRFNLITKIQFNCLSVT